MIPYSWSSIICLTTVLPESGSPPINIYTLLIKALKMNANRKARGPPEVRSSQFKLIELCSFCSY